MMMLNRTRDQTICTATPREALGEYLALVRKLSHTPGRPFRASKRDLEIRFAEGGSIRFEAGAPVDPADPADGGSL